MRNSIAVGLLSVALLLIPLVQTYADARSEAVALLEAMNAKARYEETLRQVQARTGVETELAQSDLMNRVFNEMVRIYAEVYTEEELRGMRQFFESPAGKAFLAKTPQLTEKYVEVLTAITAETD